MTDQVKVNAQKIVDFMDEVSSVMGPCNTELFKAFVYVAQHEGASNTEVQQKLDLPQSTVSRLIGQLNTDLGLVKSEEAPEERRRKRHLLTDHGRQFLARLAVIIACLIGIANDDGMEMQLQDDMEDLQYMVSPPYKNDLRPIQQA